MRDSANPRDGLDHALDGIDGIYDQNGALLEGGEGGDVDWTRLWMVYRRGTRRELGIFAGGSGGVGEWQVVKRWRARADGTGTPADIGPDTDTSPVDRTAPDSSLAGGEADPNTVLEAASPVLEVRWEEESFSPVMASSQDIIEK